MSKAYHHVKNFDWKTMANYLKYGEKDPSILTHKQKITRLYRNTLRNISRWDFHMHMGSLPRFVHSATMARNDFDYMMTLPKDSKELELMTAKWERFVDDSYDADEIIHESRPYAAASARYYIYSNEKLTYDPIGYYIPRHVAGSVPDQYQQYGADYPMTDTFWTQDETS